MLHTAFDSFHLSCLLGFGAWFLGIIMAGSLASPPTSNSTTTCLKNLKDMCWSNARGLHVPKCDIISISPTPLCAKIISNDRGFVDNLFQTVLTGLVHCWCTCLKVLREAVQAGDGGPLHYRLLLSALLAFSSLMICDNLIGCACVRPCSRKW